MISFLVGIIFIGLGAYGITLWFPDFLSAIRGLLPLSLVLGGFVAVVAGLGSLSSRKRPNVKKAE